MSDLVLVLDDSLTVRMDLTEAFQAADLRVVPCETIAAARAAFGREAPTIVVLDVVLPDGDGVAFLEELRASPRGGALTILMLSSEAEIADRIRGLKMGADEYVGKPYDSGYVVARAREVARGRRADGAEERPTVLVIDDSATFREALRGALESAGYDVVVAGSGEEGLRIAATQRPRGVVVDGVLPGLDGASVIRSLRLDVALRDVPCVLLTGAEDRGAELRALDAGADAFVRKDGDIDVVLAKLGAALRRTSAAGATRPTSALGPKKILAVDDSTTYLEALAAILRDDRYDVILAHSGEQALELLAVERVDCILLDLLMPGIGGRETCRRIKAATAVRDTPLIILTSLDDRAAMLEGLGEGADDYIQKSAEFDVLKARVRAQIRRRQSEDENRRIREELLQKELEAQEARAARDLAETRAVLVEELERKNRELEAFSYSVSHDLRAPLRGIDGYSQALLEDYAGTLDETAQGYLRSVRAGVSRMAALIEDMLALSRVSRADLRRERVDLSAEVHHVMAELQRADPGRQVELVIQPGLQVAADPRLMRIALENLLGNAWKFTGKVAKARIDFSVTDGDDGPVYLVRDNGAGFNMRYAGKLFRPFQRLHSEGQFVGTGIGLATVHRVVERHGGRVWAEGVVGDGATFFFTLGKASGARQ